MQLKSKGIFQAVCIKNYGTEKMKEKYEPLIDQTHLCKSTRE